ncbi:hypothetical protein CEW88_04495 [Alloyangia pacifica]|uniref:UvrD-like helicase C-terminal domain-containing protein n=1 Tax=Alloyangia pacifica TaxID=311180 RepID=A0A2U8HB51_9RHOB|nr:AAA family ATPase [Alloyangia pacifica]AWI82984.1 hypothetical protein CEW88_04495 [Alloyangia pacifica]
MHQLNQEQQHVAQRIRAMQQGDRLVVSGRAGSGKTFAIARSVEGLKALFLTPTHVARSVLAGELGDTRHHVMTIHSAIGWRRYLGSDLRWRETYRPAQDARSRAKQNHKRNTSVFSKADIIIVDECSLVGSFQFGAIEAYAREFNLPVVYTGDLFQLPPVRDREVIAEQEFETITMKASLRFPEDSDIYRLGELLRRAIEEAPDDDLPILYSRPSTQVLSGQTWMEQLTSGYAERESLLAVTYSNKRQRRLRSKLRQLGHNRLAAGDHVISKRTDGLFQNGEQFTISKLEPETKVLCDVPACASRNQKLTLSGYTLTFCGDERVAFVVENRGEIEELEEHIRQLHYVDQLTHAEAAQVLQLLDNINSFELSALSTVHKSQGRSVDTVYIDTKTVLRRPPRLSPRDHKRLLYTAITRARKQVIFYEMAGYCQQAPGAKIIPFPPAPANPTSGHPQSRAA